MNRQQIKLLAIAAMTLDHISLVFVPTGSILYYVMTQLFDNEMMLAALIDRVTFRSFVLNMNCSSSYRFDATVNS